MPVRSIGDTLRNARERRGITLAEVARTTRISEPFLRALEANEFEALPAPVYARGFIRSYANYLRLDPQPLLDALAGGNDVDIDAPAAPTADDRDAPEEAAVHPMPRRLPSPVQAPAPIPGPFDEHRTRGTPPPRPASPHEFPLAPGPTAGPSPQPLPAGRGVVYDDEGDGGRITRWLAAAGVVAVAAVAVAAFLVIIGGGDNGTPAAGGDAETETEAQDRTPDGAETVVTVPGTPTPAGTADTTPDGGADTLTPDGTETPAPDGTPTANPTATPATDGTPAPSATPTPTPAASPTEEDSPTATPTEASTPTPSETPTPTPSATPTPFPTPTATAVPVPSTYAFCIETQAGFDCGPSPIRVVCTDDGRSFADPDDVYDPVPNGWRVVQVDRAGLVISACG